MMPAIFFGHGNPMNALLENDVTRGWAQLGRDMPRPKAVLAVSAHWYGPELLVTSMEKPRTIHDFGGFPPELYQVQYPAPGDPKLAGRVQALVAPFATVGLDDTWGLDHGTWSVLKHVFPKADIPVVQLSIDERQPPLFHHELGQHLRLLREEDVLVIGSGNLVHNLHAYSWGRHQAEPYDWAVRFETAAKDLMKKDDPAPLIDYETMGKDALLAVPTPDHYYPLLTILGLRDKKEPVTFPVEGIDGGSISMLTVKIG